MSAALLNKSYPTSVGNRRMTIVAVEGPVLYAPYTAPTTGGQNVQGFPFGVKSIDFALGAVSRSGLYRAEVVQIEESTVQGRTLGRTQVVLKWYVVSTGDEAAAIDLSGETVDILLIGDQ